MHRLRPVVGNRVFPDPPTCGATGKPKPTDPLWTRPDRSHARGRALATGPDVAYFGPSDICGRPVQSVHRRTGFRPPTGRRTVSGFSDSPDDGRSRHPLESTVDLLAKIRRGDNAARERLIARYLPALQKWAHGRLPGYARSLALTDDLVQDSLLRALARLEGFEPRHPGAFLAYLRQILLNQVRDEIRRARRRPGMEPIGEDVQEMAPSPLEQAIGRERLAAYEKALAQLPDWQQEAVVLRIEMGFTHEQVAEAIGSPSANAARMLVTRALVRLAAEMDGVGHERAREGE